MSRIGYLDEAPPVGGEQTPWPHFLKMLLAYLIAILLLSPALLGHHWEWFLPE